MIPGRIVKHRWITDECRANKDDEGAAREAVESLYTEALVCMVGWQHRPGVRFHFVLTVEPPAPPGAARREPEPEAERERALEKALERIAGLYRTAGDPSHAEANMYLIAHAALQVGAPPSGPQTRSVAADEGTGPAAGPQKELSDE